MKAYECVIFVNEIKKRQNATLANSNINSVFVRHIRFETMLRAKFSYFVESIFHSL